LGEDGVALAMVGLVGDEALDPGPHLGRDAGEGQAVLAVLL
jgi:hypothetical protein